MSVFGSLLTFLRARRGIVFKLAWMIFVSRVSRRPDANKIIGYTLLGFTENVRPSDIMKLLNQPPAPQPPARPPRGDNVIKFPGQAA